MISFSKMHGIGNDFILVDRERFPIPDSDLSIISRQLCDRRLGVGSDGFILVERGSRAPWRMRMFNPDGSESEMCGNGVRCFAKFLQEHSLSKESVIPVETGAGVLQLEIRQDGQVRVNMGRARLTRGEIGMSGPAGEEFVDREFELGELRFRGTAVSMGNPHLVIFVPSIDAVPLENWGPKLEHHPMFPDRVNVHFVEVVDRSSVKQRTWERGAGITLACGTGACAVGVASFLNGFSEPTLDVTLPGGKLRIEYQPEFAVWMTGPAETVFEGSWPYPMLAAVS